MMQAFITNFAGTFFAFGTLLVLDRSYDRYKERKAKKEQEQKKSGSKK